MHRDYSLTGKDVKVAVYDDMIEITSRKTRLPGEARVWARVEGRVRAGVQKNELYIVMF